MRQMTPKIDIQTHNLLFNLFYFPSVYGPKEKLDADVNEIKNFVQEFGIKILSEIEILSGFPWFMDRIPVVLVPNNKFLNYSYSRFDLEPGIPGVVLKIRGAIRDKWILIHELVHTNQKHVNSSFDYAKLNTGERNNDLLEVWADLITLKIIIKYFPEWEGDFLNFFETEEKNIRKGKILRQFINNWDLEKNDIKFYLEKDKNLITKKSYWDSIVI